MLFHCDHDLRCAALHLQHCNCGCNTALSNVVASALGWKLYWRRIRTCPTLMFLDCSCCGTDIASCRGLGQIVLGSPISPSQVLFRTSEQRAGESRRACRCTCLSSTYRASALCRMSPVLLPNRSEDIDVALLMFEGCWQVPPWASMLIVQPGVVRLLKDLPPWPHRFSTSARDPGPRI